MSSGSLATPMGEAPSLPRALVPALAVAAALAAAVMLAHALRPLLSRPVQTLRVEGRLTHLAPAQIAAAAAIAPGTGLFDVDLAAARDRVEALPWVSRARVARVWPASVAVQVTERQAMARWGSGGLVDADGIVFAPALTEVPAGLPQLSGPPGRAPEVERVYRELGAALKDSPFVPAGLDLSSRGEWTLHTAGGIELRLGEQAPQSRAGLILGVVTHALADKLAQVAYVDLRYSNGFAVGQAAAPAVAARAGAAAAAASPAGSNGAKEIHAHE
jgi:cell division protein FtsQ